MRVYRRWINTFFAGTALIAAILAWILFAPVKMGGQSGYVIITGNSMEPGFYTGDLVVVLQANEYKVGDAVIYWNVELKRFVFHRIIEVKLDRFVFQGDNNSWIDSYEPTKADLIGKLWFSIPKIGKVVEWIRNPIIIGLTVGALGGIFVAFLYKRSNKKKQDQPEQKPARLTLIKEWFLRTFSLNGRLGSQLKALSTTVKNGPNPARGTIQRVQNSNIRGLNSIIEACFFILGLVAIGSLVLGIFAFTDPVNQTLSENLPYKHTGNYSYSAPAPAGVYDAPSVRSGDPIFPKLTCSINLQFSYQLAGEQLQNLQGTHQLTALIRENTTGWTRTIPLERSAVKFSGDAFESAIPVNLCQIQSIVDTMEEQTGISQKNYSLVIDPKVEIAGTISGIDLKTSFRPELVFQFDKVQIYMVQDDPDINPLAPTLEGFVTNKYITANTLKIFALTLTVASARSIAFLGLLISLAVLLILSMGVASLARASKETLVRMKYGSLLVDVQPRSLELEKPAVEVVSVDDLAKLAERNNAMILHEIQGYVHTYMVEGDQITYRYTINEGPDGQTILDSNSSISSFNLRQGIERGEFKVYYQPIVSLLDEKIIAVEALMRWQHPQNGLISAKDFIRAAESTGLIDTLGEWMLQVACAQLKEWRQGGNPLRLSVNFSRRQLEKDPAQIIARVLTKTGLTADALQIEIPEDSLTVNPKHILTNLARLKELGVNISVDGFSGQSSLSSLHELPIDSIKIDRLVIDKVNQPEDAEYIQGIISAALEQGLNVVAEGVETEEQMSFLRSQLCSQAQGYLIARPAPAQELTELLYSHQGSTLSKKTGKKNR